MTDISRKLSTGEREILKNQRLILMALIAMGDQNSKVTERLMRRIIEMDRDWEFIAEPEDRMTIYERS